MRGLFDLKQNTMAQTMVIQFILTLCGIIMVLPFIWMILTSLKTPTEAFAIPPVIFPAKWMFSNYVQVFKQQHFNIYFFNTFVVTISKTILQLLICSLAAYSFARLNFPGKNFLFILVLSALMLPHQVTLIPSFILMRELGWIDTYYALIIPGVFSAFGTFLLRQAFMTVPKELEESAQIDGCSYLGIYWQIYISLSKSSLVALAIFTIMASWNDFLWPLIMTNSEGMRVISIGIASMVGQHSTNYSLLMCAGVIATLPMILAFMFLQKYFIEGITLTGIKG
jgi:multiple sugar transport system permease protein